MEQQTQPIWFKDAIIYQIHPRAFYEKNSDGIGEFFGLTEKLDYLKELGMKAIWLKAPPRGMLQVMGRRG